MAEIVSTLRRLALLEGWVDALVERLLPYGVCQVYVTPEFHFPVMITPNSFGVFNTRGFPV